MEIENRKWKIENGKWKIRNIVTLNLCFSEQMVFTSKTFLFLSKIEFYFNIIFLTHFLAKISKIVDYFLFSLCLNKKDFDKSSFIEYYNFFIKKENDLDAMCHGFRALLGSFIHLVKIQKPKVKKAVFLIV